MLPVSKSPTKATPAGGLVVPVLPPSPSPPPAPPSAAPLPSLVYQVRSSVPARAFRPSLLDAPITGLPQALETQVGCLLPLFVLLLPFTMIFQPPAPQLTWYL